jgi:hypothetical protein
VKVGKPDPRDDSYNIDPGRRYDKITRTLSIVDLRLTGPSLPKPIRILDDYDQTLSLKPGEYMLKGAYQLAVNLPDSSLGGRPLVVEMQATLKPVS